MLQHEDKKLISEFLQGDPGNRFYTKFRGPIFSVTWEYTKNGQDAEDLTQEIFLHILDKLSADIKIDHSLSSWISKVAENYCIDYLRKKRREMNSQFKAAPLKGGKKADTEFEKDLAKNQIEKLSNIDKLKTYRFEIYQGLEISIDYIGLIFTFKKERKYYQEDWGALLKAKIILQGSKGQIRRIFTGPSAEEIEKIWMHLKPQEENIDSRIVDLLEKLNPLEKLDILRRHYAGSDPYPDELKMLNEKLFLQDDNKTFLDLLEKRFSDLFQTIEKKTSRKPSTLTGCILDQDFMKFIDDIPYIKIDPLKLLFRVWRKALRKGKYTKLSYIEKLIVEFKEKTKGYMHGFIFNSVNSSFNIETLRKKLYRDSSNKEFYEDLADYIYKKSFIEMKSPYEWRNNP